VALADITTGMYASNAVLAALYHRERTGEGQAIDLALLDAQVSVLVNQGMNWLIGGTVPVRSGNGHPNIVPYQAFATADGHIILAVGNDEQFRRFCEAAGCAHIAADPRYLTIAERNAHRDTLIPALAEVLRQRSSRDWVERLEAAQVPCGPINTIKDVFEDPQVIARGMRLDLPHPRAGTLPSIANPIRFSGTPIEYTHAPPVLGQHTDEVLRDVLGLDDAEIEQLRRDGAL
jgi:crotonobetainyl-CoA:carnitine CoA-transferase CaiB-like acyl-CoA transferase